jgi:membrane-associated phospholipid phosphatase
VRQRHSLIFSSQKKKGLLLIIILAAVVMSAVVVVDKSWTIFLHAHKYTTLERLMNSSVFEGRSMGANDPVIFYLMGAIFIYYMGWRSLKMNSIAALRPQCGFILISAVVNAVYLVHGLKWVVGRARPYEVLQDHWPYSHWFSFGPHFVLDGLYPGSFPSGHTAQAFIFMTLAYALAADPLSSKFTKSIGWFWGVFVLMLTCGMAAARSMSLSHWISDGIGSIMFGWVLMHLLFFYVLKVPEQRRYSHVHRCLPSLPPVWEIVLCMHIFLGTIGIMAVLIGTKALIIDRGPWLVLLVPVGAVLIWWARQKSLSLLHSVWQIIDIRAS